MLIVVNNNGGQIFSMLPTPQSERGASSAPDAAECCSQPRCAMFSLAYHARKTKRWMQPRAAPGDKPGATVIELVVNETDGAQKLQSLLAQVSQL